MQSKIILESLYQLRYFCEYALSLAEHTKEEDKIESYQEIARSYAEMYNVFHDIYESKKELIEKHINEVADDVVFFITIYVINYFKFFWIIYIMLSY
jgi:hypothetical protein